MSCDLHCACWQIDAHQAVEDDQTYYQEAAEGEGAAAAEKAALDLDDGPKDVEYASIDFSLLKRKSPREAAKQQETAETEYAEIKKEVKEEREDSGGEEGAVLEGKEEEETKHSVPEEEEGQDVAVYVKDEFWGLCCIEEFEDNVSLLSLDVMDWCNGWRAGEQFIPQSCDPQRPNSACGKLQILSLN